LQVTSMTRPPLGGWNCGSPAFAACSTAGAAAGSNFLSAVAISRLTWAASAVLENASTLPSGAKRELPWDMPPPPPPAARRRCAQHPGEQRALCVLENAVDVLVHRDRHEARGQHLDDLGIGQARRTVENAVVSDTTERMAAADQHEDRLLRAGRLIAGLKDG